MNIVVLVKQVPDTYSERKLTDADHTLDRESSDAVLDEINERAVEEALRIKEAGDAQVTVVCMGPDGATDAIRKALSMGADAAVHVSDAALHGSDALVSVNEKINEPRYPSFKGIMAAKKKPVSTLALADLGVDAGEVGLGGAATTVLEAAPKPPRTAGERVEDSGDGGVKVAEYLVA